MDFIIEQNILLAAFILDIVSGDPYFLFHPVRWMGKAIKYFEPCFRKIFANQVIAGTFFAVFLIFLSWSITYIIVYLAQFVHPFLKIAMEIIILYFCISIKSLQKAAMDVYFLLLQKRIDAAKKKVALIVGRDVDKLTEKKIAQAAIETVAENLVDGIISPLFFWAMGGAPFAMAYKMINTLDSMVGYKNEKYEKFGKAGARIDDFANFVPARLSIIVISLASHLLAGRAISALKCAFEERKNHTSPNAGCPEAAFAGALDVKLGGPNFYHGRLVFKPYIGNRRKKVKIKDIKKACDLMIISSVLWVLVVWIFIIVK